MNFDATLQRVPNTSSYQEPPPAQSQNQSLAQRLGWVISRESRKKAGRSSPIFIDLFHTALVVLVWMYRQIPKDNWAKFALFWSMGQFLVVTSFQAIVLARHVQEFDDLRAIQNQATGPASNLNFTTFINQSRAITVYEGLFLAAQFFQLYLAFDAIISSSKIQLLSQTLFNLSIVGDAILQYVQTTTLFSDNNADTKEMNAAVKAYLTSQNFVFDRTRIWLIIVILLSAIFFGVWCFLSSKLYNIFGWSIFKELGADVGVRQRLKLYHIYVMLLKLDIFFFLGFIIQYSILVYWANNEFNTINFYGYTYGGPVLAIILLFIAYYSVVKESNVLMTLNLVCLSGAVGFLISRLVDIYTTTDKRKYSSSKSSLTVFAALTLVLSIITFVVAILNFRNFGKGLMSALTRNKASARQHEMDNLNYKEGGRY
ncbi:hypothetical protein BC829DRAFT_476493 [Chytridium lagenaria]|nr:hypothetical protein BC829DRAFT_476493 [Chytridium lagenaria]